MTPPTDPYQAVTHADPYPYYAELRARGGLHRAPGFGPWIAADAATVRAVLTSEHCRVRPRSEPVPAHLVGTAAGALFGRLVRMNDGGPYPAVKQTLARALPEALREVEAESRRQAARLFATPSRIRLPDAALQLPVFVLGSLLGFPEDTLEASVRDVDAYVRSVAGSPGDSESAARLNGRVAACFQSTARTAFTARLMEGHGPEDLRIPNAVGLLTQAYEATAGLLGATLRAFACVPGLHEQLSQGACTLDDVVQEAARHDSPVQNTRRFTHAAATVAGQALEAGETLVVVLAAANRDPLANPQPDAFLPRRAARQTFTFGLGSHACPGHLLATAMTTAAVERMLASGLDLSPLSGPVTWRASTNTRVLGGLE
ncbi:MULTISPECIES: cytochrome P450 [unclassified Corallococcus]|uniref:cytochrome P450 n=1 Tax=unclassified Corallococcus TaxID=2685029 RepID=UPI001A8DC07B|nr:MULTISPECIES: cytochrome P450 [unclassified Corallococcus]MBN9684451.1 cytochrome P450 [Corallococcus sp. NCSPR001]WAS84072.1 cytochrome P450 [Corallococcus sp. NCRR]